MTEVPGMSLRRHEATDAKSLRYHLTALLVMVLTILIVYFDTFRSMVETWLRSDTFLHGFIILPLSAYLIWQKWPQIRSIRPQLFFPGIFLLLVVSTVWFLADALGVQVGKQLVATAAIPAVFLTVMGVSFSRAIAFPLAYLIFAVPFGEFWVPQLMQITADFAVALLRVTGIPVFRDGLFLSIPTGDFEVAEACSGIRYILATLALGTIYAYVNYRQTYKRLIFIAFSLILPILANGIRAYGIIAIAYYSDMKYAVGVDHIIYGWIFFGVVIGLMFLVGNRYVDDDPADPGPGPVPVDARYSERADLGRLALIALVAGISMMIGPLASHALASRLAQDSVFSNGLPSAVAGWQGTVLPDSDWEPSFIGATQESIVRYLGSEAQVDVALIRYATRQQGSELANGSNSIFGSKEWQRRNTRTLDIELGDGRSVQILETLAVRHGLVRRFWYWYEVDGKSIVSSLEIKLNEARSLVMGKSSISSAIIISVVDDGSNRDVLLTFLQDAYDAIGECMIAIEPQKDCDLGLLPALSEVDPK